MLELLILGIGLAVGGGAEPVGKTDQSVGLSTEMVKEAPQVAAKGNALGFEAEPQTPSGKFTTATEVKPILQMTKANWVAVREYDGHDIVYFTHLLSWRCGLKQVKYALNDAPMQVYDLPPCHEDSPTPNAILENEGMPIMGLTLKSVQSVTVELLYDDLSVETAQFERAAVLIP
ncbi:MAG: hypothetical protein JXR13_03045 [Thalassovita sp.]